MKKESIRRANTKSTIQTIEAVFEVIVLAIVYYLAWRFLYNEENFPNYFGKGKYILAGLYALISFFLMANLDGFQIGTLRRTDLALAQWIGLLLTNFITYFQLCLIANEMVSPLPILLLMLLQIVLVVVFVCLYTWIYHKIYRPYNMAMVFGSNNAVVMKLKMDSRRDKYRISKLIPIDVGTERIFQELPQYDAVVLNDIPAQMRNDILKFCYNNDIRVYAVPKVTDLLLRGADAVTAFDTPMLVLPDGGLNIGQRFVKRAMDIIISLLAMIVAAPIMLCVAIAIKCEDGGPVFYKQKRVTLNGREFEVVKFRSMIPNAEKLTGAVLASEHDPRITKVGRFVRATRLDEIPQILNILKGDMSIVGPRPERKVFIEEFCREMPEFAYRTKVKAGLTGYAQIYGKYNTTPYDKLRLDMVYISQYSILLDIKLILTTIRILFSKESTEGIDVAEENQQKAGQLLKQIQEEQEKDLTAVGGE